jgi:putative ABC transport system substrate-binding protein
MNRRAFIGTLAGGLLAAPLAAEAQPAGKVYRIGMLGSTAMPDLLEAFRKGLRDLGWIEGNKLKIEYRFAGDKLEQLPDLANELVRLGVDVIVATNPQSTAAAQQATTIIPIVLVAVANPVKLGLVSSLAHPGGNITGVATMVPEGFAGKGLELLMEIRPRPSRIAILINPTNAMHRTIMSDDVPTLTQAYRVTLQGFEAGHPELFDGAFAAIAQWRADALWVFGDPVFGTHRTRIVELAARHKLPAMFLYREDVAVGGLMSYGPNLAELYHRAAIYVNKILRGAQPSDLPVEQPTKFELVINLKTAKALGLTIPPSLLQRADQVIE